MKKNIILVFCLVTCIFGQKPAFANNLAVENVSLVDKNMTNDTYDIQFDIAWDNCWFITGAPSATANWDTAWVFAKFSKSTDSGATWSDWAHCTLLNTGNTAPSGSQMSFGATDSVYKGVFIYRSSAGSGSVDWDDAEIRWAYGTDGVGDTDTVKVKLFAMEMVYIPTGNFYVGDGTSTNIRGQFEAQTSGSAFEVTSEGALTLGGGGAGSLGNNNGGGMSPADDFNDSTSQTLPAGFPKGYNAFYIMKYEISQGQYRDFLNTLTRTQQNTRTASQTADRFVMVNTTSILQRDGIRAPSAIPSGAITFGCDLDADKTFNESDDGEWIACHHSPWMDVAAYTDWAALRPMTELEFEKAARGGQTPVANEYAWGDATVESATTSLTNAGTTSEVPNQGNLNYSSSSPDGPFRVGSFADASSTRANAGAGYYGALELSGSVYERAVSVGNSTGRLFTGTHGDGLLTTTTGYEGNATNTDWPGIDATSARGVTGATGARVEDVLRGKVWAAGDETRRPSKRQKDLADIMRLVEMKKGLVSLVPAVLRKKLSI
ncbi:MAG: SUMF1/EgtB/PvdO family nonheme iron enzyme [Candidatus Omnitrophota bacterium]